MTVVHAQHLVKTYRIFERPLDRLLQLVRRRPLHREFRALDDVSFTLERGEGLGVIGENGAGKSTLLKILTGVTAPTSGTASVAGRVASILELGSGFHPELTGRQNIVLNAAMLGLTESDIERKTPAIIDFSELGAFIDQPVKCYSTGMGMRLGFAIATQVEPDVLIVDEALSVGDGYFQKKCIDRLLEFTQSGGTLLFCSHAMYYVSAFCKRALWLRAGRVAGYGPAHDVVRQYEEFLLTKSAPSLHPAPRSGPARILRAELAAGLPVERFGDRMVLEIEWECDRETAQFHLGVGINRIDGVEVASFSSVRDGLPAFTGALHHRAALDIPELPIVKGAFNVYVFLLDEAGLHVFDQRIVPEAFAIETPSYQFGLVEVPHSWRSLAPSETLAQENLQHA